MTTHFINPGNLPFEAIALIGVSVKEGGGNIGRFGTGLKYAIAGILRLGGRIAITTREYHATFDTKPVTIRGKEFQTIRAHIHWQTTGKNETLLLGFTTDYGKEWKPWMYVRELLSNCLDEGGTHGSGEGTLRPATSKILSFVTLINVSLPEFDKAYIERSEWYLEATPTTITEFGDIHISPSNGVYYQGFLVGAVSTPTLCTYNIKGDIPLSEDRTMGEYYMRGCISNILGKCEDTELLTKVFCCDVLLHLEGRIDLRNIVQNSATAKEILKDLWKNSPTKLNKPAVSLASDIFTSEIDPPPYDPTSVEKAMFKRSLTFLRDLNLDTTKVEWKFINSEDAAYGYVPYGTKTIFLNKILFAEGTSLVCRCMFEEFLHAEFQVEDFSREFQNKTISILARFYEETKGEPL